MTAAPRASVIIPAFNEAANIEAVVGEAVAVFAASAWTPFEVVVIDDGSADDTGRLADAMAAADPRIRVIHHDGNRGWGTALRTGLAAARGEAITYLAGDGQIPPAGAVGLLDGLADGVPLVIGRRLRKATMMRDAMTVGFRFATRILVGEWFANTPAQFAGRADLLKAMPLLAASGTLILEMTLRCARQGLPVRWVTIRIRQRASGKTKMGNWRTAVAMVRELLRLRRELA